MDSSRTLILDCGINRVSLAIFSRRDRRLCLNYFATQSVASAASGDGENLWLDRVRSGFRALAEGTTLRGRVLLVLPAHLTLIKAIKIPRMEAVQRDKLIAFEAAQAIPYALADVVWGWVVVGETTTELEVLLATAKKDLLESLWAAANDAGFVPRVILPAPFATVAGFKSIQGAEKERFLGLNIGARSTTLVQINADSFALRSFGLNLDSAVGRKAVEGKASTLALEPVNARLLQEITRSLVHFQSGNNLANSRHICLTGEGAPLASIAESLRTKLSASVEMPDLSRAIDFGGADVARAVTAQSTALIDLIGAAVTQLYPDHAVINLLPERAHQQVTYRRRRPWLVATALLSTGVLLPPLLHFHQLQVEALKKTAAIDRELAPLRIRSTTNQVKLRQVENWRQQIIGLELAQERRTSWLRFLVSLQASLDEVGDVWLENFQLAPTAPAAPLRILVSGRMLDRAHPLAKVSSATFDRVKAVLARFAASPFVTAVEAEHFDNQRPGMLKFDFVLVTDETRSL